MIVKMDGKYQTRNRQFSTDDGNLRILGVNFVNRHIGQVLMGRLCDGEWVINWLTTYGHSLNDTALDLIELPQKFQLYKAVNVHYLNGKYGVRMFDCARIAHDSPDIINSVILGPRVACLELTIEGEHGEGLITTPSGATL